MIDQVAMEQFVKCRQESARQAGEVIPLEDYQARVYTVASSDEAENLAEKFDFGDCEWLFSYADYGEFGTPVPVIIQQDRKKLNSLRSKLNEKDV